MRSWVAIRLDRRWINCFTLVMEEDGSMRPSAERQDYGQGSDSGGKKIVVFVELHSNTWEDRSLRDEGLYIEFKGDCLAGTLRMPFWRWNLWPWLRSLTHLGVMLGRLIKLRWGIDKNQLGSYKILRLLGKFWGHLMRDLKTEWRSS